MGGRNTTEWSDLTQSQEVAGWAGTAKTSVATPNYGHIKATGQRLPHNPYHARKGHNHCTSSLSPTKVNYRHPVEPWPWIQEVPVVTSFQEFGRDPVLTAMGSYSWQSLYDEATRKFYDKLADVDINLLVAGAEAPKTFGMIASNVRRIAGTLRSLKKGDVSGAMKSLGLSSGGRHGRSLARRANNARRRGGLKDFSADAWLEVKYGWKPLINDVYGAVEALEKSQEASDVDISIRVRRHGDKSNSLLDSLISDGTDNISVEQQLSMSMDFRVFDPNVRGTNALGLTNPALVVWELIPYSFVFDWFIPVGDFIAAQTALGGLTFVDGSYTKKLSCKGSAHITEWNGVECSFFQECDISEVQRIKMDEPPDIARILYAKGLKKALNFDKVVTALALLNNVR